MTNQAIRSNLNTLAGRFEGFILVANIAIAIAMLAVVVGGLAAAGAQVVNAVLF